MKTSRLLLIAGALATTPFASAQAPITALDNPLDVNVEDYLNRIELPDGFSIAIYASGMDEARSMAIGDDGTLYVGTRGGQGEPPIGKVYAIPNQDGDDEGDEVLTILEDLFYPNGLAFHDGDLYVAEINRVLKYEDISGRLHDMPEPVVLVDTLDQRAAGAVARRARRGHGARVDVGQQHCNDGHDAADHVLYHLSL